MRITLCKQQSILVAYIVVKLDYPRVSLILNLSHLQSTALETYDFSEMYIICNSSLLRNCMCTTFHNISVTSYTRYVVKRHIQFLNIMVNIANIYESNKIAFFVRNCIWNVFFWTFWYLLLKFNPVFENMTSFGNLHSKGYGDSQKPNNTYIA